MYNTTYASLQYEIDVATVEYRKGMSFKDSEDFMSIVKSVVAVVTEAIDIDHTQKFSQVITLMEERHLEELKSRKPIVDPAERLNEVLTDAGVVKDCDDDALVIYKLSQPPRD
jgi:hypothetical protein